MPTPTIVRQMASWCGALSPLQVMEPSVAPSSTIAEAMYTRRRPMRSAASPAPIIPTTAPERNPVDRLLDTSDVNGVCTVAGVLGRRYYCIWHRHPPMH